MSNEGLRWLFGFVSIIAGFLVAQIMASKITNIYYIVSQVLFALVFSGALLEIYDRFVQKK